MVNVKKKGNRNENDFANWLQANGIKAYRNSASGATTAKGDINNSLDMTIECKHVKKINLQEAWKQVKRDAEMASNTPLLAIRFDGMPENTWLMVMNSGDWLEAVKSPKVEVSETTDDRSMKWAMEGLKIALNKVLRYL